jgi:hypothetical protein
MGTKKTNGRKIGIPTSSIAKPSKIYPNLDFWFEKCHLVTLLRSVWIVVFEWPRGNN